MALIFVDGCDSYSVTADITKKFDANTSTTNNTFQSTGGRFGGGAIRAANSSSCFDKLIPPRGSTVTTDELFWSASIYMATISGSSSTGFVGFTGNAGFVGVIQSASSYNGVYLRVDTSGQLNAYRGGATLLATGTATLSTTTWYRIEVRLVLNDTTGILQVKVDGVLDIDFTGDTRYNNAGDASTTDFNAIKLVRHSTQGGQLYFDDIVIHDSTGSSCNSWLGDLRISTIRPDGNGSTNDGTPSTGSNYECVDETTPNDDTDYVEMSTAADRELYTHSNLPYYPASVIAAVVNTRARATGTTPRRVRGVMYRSGSASTGATIEIPALATYYNQQFPLYTDPVTTTALIGDNINNGQFGLEVVD